jgi:diguanylate cyclase (GGDEF)-like protein
MYSYTIVMPGYDHLPREQRDALTNLPNRLALNEFLEIAIQQMPGMVALLELDIDGMKEVNDEDGHLDGDKFLQTIAEVLSATIRTEDRFLAHKSGDEFTVMLSKIESEEELATIRERIRETLGDYGIETAIGGRMHRDGESVEALLAAADALMYQDKVQRKKERYDNPKAILAIRKIAQLAITSGISPRDIPTLISLAERGEI